MYDSSGSMRINKVYNNENLVELETDFNISLPKLNVGSYNTEEYYKAYNQTNIDLVKHIYTEDFVNLGYSTDFKDKHDDL